MTTLARPREGRPVLDGPHEGVPDYLHRPLTRWLENVYTVKPDALAPEMDETGLERLAALLRIDLRGTDGFGMLIGILSWTDDNDERLLDVIHYTLQIPTRMPKMWHELEVLLAYGGSMWAATSRGLQRRVDATAMEVFNAATAAADSASDHLAQAWSGAHGRNPHPASAWHHSIKALEASLRRIVCPNEELATLPFIIDQLKTGQWNLELRGQARDYAIDPLVRMLELVWPDPNRHGSHALESAATKEEAGAVVLLAVTIVQWARNGQIIKADVIGKYRQAGN